MSAYVSSTTAQARFFSNRSWLCVMVFLLIFAQPGIVLAQETVTQDVVLEIPKSADAKSSAITPTKAPNDTGSSDTTVEETQSFDTESIKKDTKAKKEPKPDPEVEPEPEPEPQALESGTSGSDYTVDREPIHSSLQVGTDDVTGALVYSYPITTPPGRNGVEPQLRLQYSSQNHNNQSLFGYGWSVNIPSIERIARFGVDVLYAGDSVFSSSFDGELATTTTANMYGAKDEFGSFNTYEFANDVWTMTDKQGTVYTFGATTASRQDSGSNIYKWMLSEVRDQNDNYITYTYFKNNGQIYPEGITYTGNGSTDGVFSVAFGREMRSDASTEYATGFAVTTNYRIKDITTKVAGGWVRKYALGYGTGDNQYRSMLTSVTESGSDGQTVITMPATTFSYQSRGNSWAEDTNYTLPEFFVEGSDNGVRFGDVNGDGLVDILRSHDTVNKVYTNKGDSTGWQEDATIIIPEKFKNNGQDWGTRLADVNGDGYVDVLRAVYGGVNVNKVYINNGDGTGWTYDAAYFIPEYFVNQYGQDLGTRIADVNGDGLADIVRSFTASSGGGVYVYLNNGDSTGWTFTNNFGSLPPFAFVDPFYTAIHSVRLMEVNGDGLVDLVDSRDQANKKVYINTGTNFVEDAKYVVPFIIHNIDNNDIGSRFVDINGDGLTDVISAREGSGKPVYINKGDGTGWASPAYYFPEYIVSATLLDLGTRLIDINGDGLVDVARSYPDTENIQKTYIAQGEVADLLSDINHHAGSDTTITYTATPEYTDSGSLLNPDLQDILQTASTITVDDGFGTQSVTTYQYEGGEKYFNHAYDKKFAGFANVKTTASNGTEITKYYHQGNDSNTAQGEHNDHISKRGRVYLSETKDAGSNLFARTITKWEKQGVGGERNFVTKAQIISQTFDGDADHKDTAQSFMYDSTYGNVTQQTSWGEVQGSVDGTFSDIGTDTYTTNISYAANVGEYIVGLPSQQTMLDQSSAVVSKSRMYYDNQALGQVTTGNLTKQEHWIKNELIEGDVYRTVEHTYNSYGLVTQTKDPRDYATTFVYDAYNLYPATVTNPKNQTTSFTYDYSLGKVESITEANGHMSSMIYDALDRIKDEMIPNIHTPTQQVSKASYIYNDTSFPRSIHQINHLDGSTKIDSYTYVDGLGRTVQTRLEAETPGEYSTQDIVYDSEGNKHKESLPYFSTGSSFTTPTTNNSLLTVTTYDAVNRPVQKTTIVGSTQYAYDDWQTTVTDALNNTKDSYKDAYGNLIQVDEHNDTSTYSTVYEYNGLQNLTKITDALGNVRNFTYDGLGRLLSSQDLHSTGDSTFGSWSYTYDGADNLTGQVDPNEQSVTRVYDELNRIVSEDYSGAAGTEKTYVYDTCTNGIGLLCSATTSDAQAQYTYYAGGLIQSESKIINSTTYTTQYDYERQGNPITIQYPDDMGVRYVYNSAGQLETVQYRPDSSSPYEYIIEDFDYGPHEQIVYQKHANGTETTYTYDTDELYRLKQKVTQPSGGMQMSAFPESQNDMMTAAFAEEESGLFTMASGGTTETFYAGPGDGLSVLDNPSWDAVHDATTAESTRYDQARTQGSRARYSGSKHKYYINRAFFPFDTSSLPDNATITDATMYVYVNSTTNDDSTTLELVQTSQASPTALVNEDYDQVGAVSGASVPISSVGGGYAAFPLNSTALGWVSVTGYTKLGIRVGRDMFDQTPSGNNYIDNFFSEQFGTSLDPYLEVTYTIGATNSAPTTPTGLLTEGSADPIDVIDVTPEFSSIFADPDSGDIATHYQIQVTATSSDWTNVMWDSGQTALGTQITEGQRSEDITYAGTALALDGTQYYWRMKYWDDSSAEGAWSDGTDTFTMSTGSGGGGVTPGVIQDLTYTYDAVGNIATIVDAADTVTAKTSAYTYDDLYRLTSVVVTNATSSSPGNYTRSYSYNAIGNITAKSDIGSYLYQGDQGANYANPHAATSINGATVTYDANGNVLSDGTWSHTWTYNNRLAQSTDETNTVSYGYDHEGQRVKLDNGTKQILYANKYFNTDGTTDTKHIYAGDVNIATIETQGSTDNVFTTHTDHLGGVQVTTNTNRELVQVLDYYPFGDIRANSQFSSTDEQRKFTGHEYDGDTDLNYMGARYYPATYARFLSQDPVYLHSPEQYLTDPQLFNSYAYGRNNPLRFVDPTGESNADFQPYHPSGNRYNQGDLLGSYRGVGIYSAGSQAGGISHNYQCVSFCQSFVSSEYGVSLQWTGNAQEYGNQSALNRSFRANNPSNPGQYTAYNNGGGEMPQENDIITWTNSSNSIGHVGIISEVVFDSESGSGYVYSAEQNWSRNRAIFVQPFSRSYNDQGEAVYTVEGRGSYNVQGWARYENQSRLDGQSTNYTSTQHTPATKQTKEQPL